MSNSTYCDDHYEQPSWMKQMERLERRVKELEAERDKAQRETIDKACEWLDGHLPRMPLGKIDRKQMIEDFRNAKIVK